VRVDVSDFDGKFSALIASFYAHKDRVFQAVWTSEIERLDTYEGIFTSIQPFQFEIDC
jgi:hypothetical protein